WKPVRVETVKLGSIGTTTARPLKAGTPKRNHPMTPDKPMTVSDTPIQPDLIERVAKAICEASGEMWRTGTYEVMSGRDFTMEDHPLDPFNNHWRGKAKAALEAADIATLQAQHRQMFHDWEAALRRETALQAQLERVTGERDALRLTVAEMFPDL